jgi:GTP-binding protein
MAEFKRRYRPVGPVFAISALTGEGCTQLCHAIWDHLLQHRATPAEPNDDPRFSSTHDLPSIPAP